MDTLRYVSLVQFLEQRGASYELEKDLCNLCDRGFALFAASCRTDPEGTVLKVADQPDVEKVTTYIKPDHFFAMPLYTKGGVLMVDGKEILADGRQIRSHKYIDGPVG